MEEKEIVWLPKSIAKKVKEMTDDRLLNEAIDMYFEESKKKIRGNLEALEEDVIQYKASMMKAKQAFREAKEEQIKASYAMWEKMDDEMPRLEEKVKQAIRRIEPFIETLEKANNLIRFINTYQFERFFEQVSEIDRIYKENPGIFEFMMKHYKG